MLAAYSWLCELSQSSINFHGLKYQNVCDEPWNKKIKNILICLVVKVLNRVLMLCLVSSHILALISLNTVGSTSLIFYVSSCNFAGQEKGTCRSYSCSYTYICIYILSFLSRNKLSCPIRPSHLIVFYASYEYILPGNMYLRRIRRSKHLKYKDCEY